MEKDRLTAFQFRSNYCAFLIRNEWRCYYDNTCTLKSTLEGVHVLRLVATTQVVATSLSTCTPFMEGALTCFTLKCLSTLYRILCTPFHAMMLGWTLLCRLICSWYYVLHAHYSKFQQHLNLKSTYIKRSAALWGNWQLKFNVCPHTVDRETQTKINGDIIVPRQSTASQMLH